MKNALALAVSFAALTAFADSAGGLNWKVPAGWKTDAPRPMRAATYKIPAAKGDAEEAELGVFYFGAGQGGDIDANVKRWAGQFQGADGKAAEPKTTKDKVAGFPATHVDVSGTYSGGMGPMQAASPKAGYRLVGAIVEGPNGNVFFKLTGPQKTVEAAKKDFDKMLASLSK